MSAVFQCPQCNEPLGTAADPKPTPLPACPSCGWREAGAKVPSLLDRLPALLTWLAILVPMGLAAGALVAHSLFWALILFVAFGPVASTGIGRRAGDGWWFLVLSYSVAFGLGILLFPDGNTVPSGAWGLSASAAGITAAVGLLIGWFSRPD